MQADLWKALLRRIPAEHIDNVMLMTAQGTEINVQALWRMDEDFIVLRGRIAGSNDAGRIFIVPYDQLEHMGFQRPLTDGQLQEVFDGVPAAAAPAAPAPAAAEPAPAPVVVPPPAAPEAAPVAQPAAEGGAAPGLLARVPTRSKIIQRLRQRSEARDSAGSPPKQ
jgi:hypothetical protein